MDLARSLLSMQDAVPPARLTYGVVATASPLTVTVGGETTAVSAVALDSYGPAASDYVAVLIAGADRLVLGRVGEDFRSYTPTIGGTGWALGDGGISGYYMRAGNKADVVIDFTFGSTSTAGSGALTFTLPADFTVPAEQYGFTGMLSDASSGVLTPLWARTTTGELLQPFYATSVTQLNNNGLVSGGPITWAVNDRVVLTASGMRLS